MHEYKTKETALRHIQKGENFTTKPFQHFWRDREVCTEALVRQSDNLFMVMKRNPDLEWDADFMDSLFNRLLNVGAGSIFSLHWIGPCLPPVITESKEIALKAANVGRGEYIKYFTPNLRLDKDVRNAYGLTDDTKSDTIKPQTASLFLERKEVFIDLIYKCPELYKSLPLELRMTREACKYACSRVGHFQYAYGGLHDDEEFVLEVLKQVQERSPFSTMFETASYRIRKACRGKEPLDYLEKFVAAKKLDATLQKKSPIQQQRTSSKKI